MITFLLSLFVPTIVAMGLNMTLDYLPSHTNYGETTCDTMAACSSSNSDTNIIVPLALLPVPAPLLALDHLPTLH